MVKKLNLHEAQKAPYLSKEDFLFKLQTTFDEPYVNLLDEGELREYAQFLNENNYSSGLFVDLGLPVGKGRFVLEARGISLEKKLSLKEILTLANEDGKIIEEILDEIILKDHFSSDVETKRGRALFEELNYHLEDLKFSGLPLEVYSHYIELYNSFLQTEADGLIGKRNKRSEN